MGIEASLTRAWYEGRWWLNLFRPLSGLFSALAARRRLMQQSQACVLPVPVVVVGNITVGGTGKTPLLIALARALTDAGFKPGIISRGYGASAPFYPFLVNADSSPSHCGDEPLLIAIETGCPVAVDPDRSAAAQLLVEIDQCDLILSDDGLQHYRLARDIEICVIDGQRGLGNGYCLPAGPLRELPARLEEVDWIVINGAAELSPLPAPVSTPSVAMELVPTCWRSLDGDNEQPLAAAPALFTRPVAVTGIGNPDRFFDTLRFLPLRCDTRAFPDHHLFVSGDLAPYKGRSILMTSKDAVKCRSLGVTDTWYLQVEAQLNDGFIETLVERVRQLQLAKTTAAS